MTITSVSKTIVLALPLSFIFTSLFVLGFFTGRNIGYESFLFTFGEPLGEQVFFAAFFTGIFAVVFALIGIIVSLILSHQIDKRLHLGLGRSKILSFFIFIFFLLSLIYLPS